MPLELRGSVREPTQYSLLERGLCYGIGLEDVTFSGQVGIVENFHIRRQWVELFGKNRWLSQLNWSGVEIPINIWVL